MRSATSSCDCSVTPWTGFLGWQRIRGCQRFPREIFLPIDWTAVSALPHYRWTSSLLCHSEYYLLDVCCQYFNLSYVTMLYPVLIVHLFLSIQKVHNKVANDLLGNFGIGSLLHLLWWNFFQSKPRKFGSEVFVLRFAAASNSSGERLS